MIEHCAACGFDGGDWSDLEAIEAIDGLPGRWRDAVAGLGDRAVERPIPSMWSVAEYVDHVRETLFGMRFVIDLAADNPGVDLGEAPEPTFTAEPKAIDVAVALDGIESEAAQLAARLRGLARDAWEASVIFDGSSHDAHWIARHAVHDASHHLMDVDRLRSALAAAAAARNVSKRAEGQRDAALGRLAALGVDGSSASRAVDRVRTNGRLTVNFHPDRHDSTGRTVAAGLLADGRYRSQFETGISNGGRFAVPGGDRTRWEHLLFDGAYDGRSSARPIYGALDLFDDPFGGSPRFGSSFIVLEPTCLGRATSCVGDSHLGPKDLGTLEQMLSVLAGAIEACVDGDGFGRDLSVADFLQAIGGRDRGSTSARELDRYVEAQIHGPIELSSDVSALHLDPSFDGTEVHRDLRAAASRYGFELTWSEGSEVRPEDIDPDFRGAGSVTLAERTTRHDGLVDAATIGRALVGLPFVPPSVEGDDESSALQRYKKLWHCCLAFGRPPQPPPRS